MKFTKYGTDWLIVDESNYKDIWETRKTHLIHLAFSKPDRDKINTVIDNFPHTNRFIVSNNVKIYNNILKNNKKYYVMNAPNVPLISFFRKNNKVILNILNITDTDMLFVKNNFEDILHNIEVLYIGSKENINDQLYDKLKEWNGNILIS